MGRPQPTTAELKRQLLQELDSARAELTYESRLARTEWNPATLARRSLEKHKLAWIVGGVVTGLVVIRLIFPPKIRSDKFGGSDTKRGFSGMMSGLFFTVARRAAMNFATTHLKDHLQNYIATVLKRQGPDTHSHVARV